MPRRVSALFPDHISHMANGKTKSVFVAFAATAMPNKRPLAMMRCRAKVQAAIFVLRAEARPAEIRADSLYVVHGVELQCSGRRRGELNYRFDTVRSDSLWTSPRAFPLPAPARASCPRPRRSSARTKTVRGGSSLAEGILWD